MNCNTLHSTYNYKYNYLLATIEHIRTCSRFADRNCFEYQINLGDGEHGRRLITGLEAECMGKRLASMAAGEHGACCCHRIDRLSLFDAAPHQWAAQAQGVAHTALESGLPTHAVARAPL